MTIPGIESQRDPRWANIELGFNTDPYYNIYHFGCGIDAAANLLWWVTGDASWTPERVNNWLKSNGGYSDGSQVNRGGLIVWGAMADLMGRNGIEYHGFTTDLGGTNRFLMPDNNFAIAQLTGPGFPMHFSAMPYVGQIADSWDARLKSVSTYTFIGAHLYTHTVPQPEPAPPPAPVPEISPAPVQAPTPAPLPQPTPELVPSTAEPVTDPNPQPVPVTVAQTTGTPEVLDAATTGVLADVEPEPEYKRTWKPFAGSEEVRLLRDTQAVDAEGLAHPVALTHNKPFLTAGTFTDNGELYYRGTSEHWYGVPATDVEGAELPAKPSFWSRLLHDPIGMLIRLFSKPEN